MEELRLIKDVSWKELLTNIALVMHNHVILMKGNEDDFAIYVSVSELLKYLSSRL